MKNNIEIIFGSTTGNTEDLAKYIKQQLIKQGFLVKLTECTAYLKQKITLNNNTIYMLASSSWGVEPVALQEDFEIFWHDLQKTNLKGNQFAIFGCGDNYYPHFCGGLNILKNGILSMQGKLLLEPLKVQDDWQDQTKQIDTWVNNFLKTIA